MGHDGRFGQKGLFPQCITLSLKNGYQILKRLQRVVKAERIEVWKVDNNLSI